MIGDFMKKYLDKLIDQYNHLLKEKELEIDSLKSHIRLLQGKLLDIRHKTKDKSIVKYTYFPSPKNWNKSISIKDKKLLKEIRKGRR